MAVTLDSTSDSGSLASAGASTQFSWNHVIGAGINRVLVLIITKVRDTASRTITQIDGILTPSDWVLLGRKNRGDDQTFSEIWYLIIPNSKSPGSYAIQVSLSGTMTVANSVIEAGGVSFFDALTPTNFGSGTCTIPSGSFNLFPAITSNANGYVTTGWTAESNTWVSDQVGTHVYFNNVGTGHSAPSIGMMYSVGSAGSTQHKINTGSSSSSDEFYGCGCFIPAWSLTTTSSSSSSSSSSSVSSTSSSVTTTSASSSSSSVSSTSSSMSSTSNSSSSSSSSSSSISVSTSSSSSSSSSSSTNSNTFYFPRPAIELNPRS